MISYTCLLAQLWKLDGNVLLNKAKALNQNDQWKEKAKDTIVHVENASKKKMSGSSSLRGNQNVSLIDFTKSMDKGDADPQGYFTLSIPSSNKVLTAKSADCLKIEGTFSI